MGDGPRRDGPIYVPGIYWWNNDVDDDDDDDEDDEDDDEEEDNENFKNECDIVLVK